MPACHYEVTSMEAKPKRQPTVINPFYPATTMITANVGEFPVTQTNKLILVPKMRVRLR